ncbi:hypothetical protein B0T22DRAFT_452555 [Podospora appendiculata]|uniref:Lytic polysaccharide monooxygenase n=1 Tax=Podospora appendiculata TaxID=314037 RepID=A0AAE0XJT9_9PEZI|nr:hypothetical protein B0T22DRAFT_452555 [Podospora appendiculata]
MVPALSAPVATALWLLAANIPVAGAHMIMRSPVAYNLNTQPFVQVDPLDGSQYPFPCQNRFGVENRTTVEAGGATLVQFTGGAQHGGGSCQFSISYEDPGTVGWNASAQFKTIYSIIGGCPAVFTDESRNLPATGAPGAQGRANTQFCGNDYDIDCTRQFMIPFPSFLKNGPATLSWTWFNKLGNREMYMTCSPINITGGTEDPKQIDELPDVFVANIAVSQNIPNYTPCTTGDGGTVLNYPNPGKYGRILQPPTDPKVKPSDYCTQIPPASLVPTFTPDNRTIQSGGASSTPVPSANNTPGAPFLNSTGTGFITVTASTTVHLSSTTCQTVETTITYTSTPGAASSAPEATPSVNPEPQASGVGNSVPCDTSGAVVCIQGGLFGLCNWGWAIPQSLAAGTKCVDGKIVGDSPVKKRHLHLRHNYRHGVRQGDHVW